MEPITLFFANNLLSNKGHVLAKNKHLDRGSKQTIEDIIDSTDKTSDQNMLANDHSPIHLRLLGQSRFILCN